MTQPFHPAGDGQLANPAPGTAAAGPAGPGVPLSIWPGLPAHDTRDGQPCAGPVTVAAARRVIDAFSVPGDLVATAGGSPSVAAAAAAAAASRRVLALTAGPALLLQRPGVPAALPPPADPAAGTAALAIAGWRGPGCCGQEPDAEPVEDRGPVFAACERVLRPGGVLAVITSPAAPGGPLVGTFGSAGAAGSVVAAARAAGLVYVQHIVLARAAIDGDRLTPAAPGTGPATPGGSPVHDDLFVFTKPGGEARS